MSDTALDIVIGFAFYHRIGEANDAERELADLRAENERLREALETIKRGTIEDGWILVAPQFVDAALSPTDQ